MKVFLNFVSCLQLHNRLSYERSDIFLCTHTPDLTNEKNGSIEDYLTIIPRPRVGYEMVNSQRGA